MCADYSARQVVALGRWLLWAGGCFGQVVALGRWLLYMVTCGDTVIQLGKTGVRCQVSPCAPSLGVITCLLATLKDEGIKVGVSRW